MIPLLSIENLSVRFRSDAGDVLAVRNTSVIVPEGKTLGIVGESGCGKSVTAFSILRLIEPPGEITSGKVLFRGRDLLQADEQVMRDIRGGDISMIFQEPMTSLNPVFTAGFQIAESVKKKPGLSKKEVRERSIELLQTVGIPSPEKRIDCYPHEFSGGMRQRIMIAMALASSPSLLIADEPTTALDVTIQAQILDLLLNLQKKKNMGMIMITHDLGIVANTADLIAIMYAGEIVESGKTKDIFNNPKHPYTIGLLEAIPEIGSNKKKLKSIKGNVPIVVSEPESCLFFDRCDSSLDKCSKGKIELFDLGNGRLSRCIRSAGVRAKRR